MFILKDKINNKYLKFGETLFTNGKFNPVKGLVDSKEDATIFNLNEELVRVFWNMFEDFFAHTHSYDLKDRSEKREAHKFRAWFRYLSVVEISEEFYVEARNGVPYEETEDYKNTQEIESRFLSELEVQAVEYFPYDLSEIAEVILRTASDLSDDSRFEWALENVETEINDVLNKVYRNHYFKKENFIHSESKNTIDKNKWVKNEFSEGRLLKGESYELK